MARRTKVVVVCDRHRGEVEATGSVEIALDGERRSLDLCAEHLSELRRTLRPWLRQGASAPASRRAGRPRKAAAKAGGRRGPVRRNTDGPAIREWAAGQGWDLPARGRIPDAVREAYYADKR